MQVVQHTYGNATVILNFDSERGEALLKLSTGDKIVDLTSPIPVPSGRVRAGEMVDFVTDHPTTIIHDIPEENWLAHCALRDWYRTMHGA